MLFPAVLTVRIAGGARLLKEGAKLVEKVEDIIEELSLSHLLIDELPPLGVKRNGRTFQGLGAQERYSLNRKKEDCGLYSLRTSYAGGDRFKPDAPFVDNVLLSSWK